MARTIDARTWQAYAKLRDGGMSRSDAAWKVGISYSSAKSFDRGEVQTAAATKVVRAQRVIDQIDANTVAPRPYDDLSDVALESLEDFDLFRSRYFGRVAKPWQREAAEVVVELEATELREWVVANVPPGGGKSTTFTHDIPLWLIVRGRHLPGLVVPRILMGSRTNRQATQYGRRARASLMRKRPTEGAQATLYHDYGQFQPDEPSLWRSEEFIVWESAEVMPSDEKEPTVMCVGMDTGFLGGRFDFVIWDDLVDASTIRTPDARSKQRQWFDDEAETRLEPGGLFMLMGQRLGPDDLYRYALDKQTVDEEGRVTEARKYRHIVFPAHDEERCVEQHALDSPPWPEGCLLDPVRLSWRDLMTTKANDPRRYDIIMQQKDVDVTGVLVPRVFIEGGTYESADLPGCLDHERGLTQLGLEHDGLVSAVSVDPSPTRYWAIQWWVYDPETSFRWLMDMERAHMDAPDFLDRLRNGQYTGIAHDWVIRAQDLGFPIDTLIVEKNAAQRFLLQYDHIKQWQMINGVSVVPHNTGHHNKADESFGVQTLRPQYLYGRVRLPWGDVHARSVVQPLIDEVTVWPNGSTDDCVMAQWMFEWNLPNLTAANTKIPQRDVPSWL